MNTMASSESLSLGQCATLACLLECTAAKPGNVHRGADFEDVTYLDFVLSAQALGPVFDLANQPTLGDLIHAGVQATRRFVTGNTNLGMILLFAPLAKVARDKSLAEGISQVLATLTPHDSRQVYEAIRLANPGGLGTAPEADVREQAPDDLIHAMSLAADRDLIARQYANGFQELFACVVPWLGEGLDRGRSLQAAIVHTQVRMMAEHPDTLIARKCGQAVADRAAAHAASVLRAGGPGDEDYERALAGLDFWLRSDGHRRNPGTTADMIAAGLFCLLREGRLKWPLQFYG